MSAPYTKKLIEVSLPLEAINAAAAHEKAVPRKGHPATLHLWWARRPLAACRAVLFAQLVDDPSAHPEEFPTELDQAVERKRLFDILERLVEWDSSNDESLLREAHEEILKSTAGSPPAVLDPFAGGGSIPLEAQRLGLRAYASDLNPVAVLINKALIEIPPQWAGRPPVFPGAAATRLEWRRAAGLAEDIRRYGQLLRDRAEQRIGSLYPKATLPDGTDAKVIAWIWARTITCPNPACRAQMPLVRSWWLSKRKGREHYVVPRVTRDRNCAPVIDFSVSNDPASAPASSNAGTVGRTGATCIACGTAVPLKDVRKQGQAGGMGQQLMAIVAEGNRRRYYLPPNSSHAEAAHVPVPEWIPDTELAQDKMNIKTPLYGMNMVADLFTPRQLTALATFSDLVKEVAEVARQDARRAGHSSGTGVLMGGDDCADLYGDAVSIYLASAVSKLADWSSSLCSWISAIEGVTHTFARQALPMTWDFVEINPLSSAVGNFGNHVEWVASCVERLPADGPGDSLAVQADAATREYENFVVSTDPPYYDNIAYANLSDFFYVWLRRSLGEVAPQLFGTIQTPKADELVADSYRHGGKREAAAFFEAGFQDVFQRIREKAPLEFPVTVFYAFKQSESDDLGTGNTGWQTLLEGIMSARWEVTATWPIRTERSARVLATGANALASSIVLALRARPDDAEALTRRSFIAALKDELPTALVTLQHGSIAPVDLAQAAIGPGMAIFSRHSRVLEADGSDMTIRTALALINQVLDEILAQQEGDFDAETRFCVKWFSEHGWNEAPSGEADVLSRAVNTTVSALERGGIFRAAAGRARLVEPADMSTGWNPTDDKAICVWEVAIRLGHALLFEGMDQAAALMHESASRVDLDAVKELAYLMYSICERKGWTESAVLFNALGSSWGDVAGALHEVPVARVRQGELDFADDHV